MNLPPLPYLGPGIEIDGVRYFTTYEVITFARQAQREAVAAAVPEWIPVTQELVNEQHRWLYKPCWIALASGLIGQGYYEWRQGHNPDRFYLDGGGDIHISEATHIMPVQRPSAPEVKP